MSRFDGKVALVAGASKGIGKATARQLGLEGASVLVNARSEEDLAATEMKRARNTEPAKMSFAYTGSPVPGEPYTYRVFAPEFVVEFLNVQADSAKNAANHIHSAWRRLPADFGLAK